MLSTILRGLTAIQLVVVFILTYNAFGTKWQDQLFLTIPFLAVVGSVWLAFYWTRLIPKGSGDVMRDANTFAEAMKESQYILGGVEKTLRIKSTKYGFDSLSNQIYQSYCRAEIIFSAVLGIFFFIWIATDYESMSTGFRGTPLRHAIGVAIFSIVMYGTIVLFLSMFLFGFFSKFIKR